MLQVSVFPQLPIGNHYDLLNTITICDLAVTVKELSHFSKYIKMLIIIIMPIQPSGINVQNAVLADLLSPVIA